jgi:hypothetical protein
MAGVARHVLARKARYGLLRNVNKKAVIRNGYGFSFV